MSAEKGNKNKLSRIDRVLNELTAQPEAKPVEAITNFGPDIMMGLFMNEVRRIDSLGCISKQLIAHFTNPATLNRLPEPEKRKTLMDVAELERDSRDFLLKFTDLANKNAILAKLMRPAPVQQIETSPGTTLQIPSNNNQHTDELVDLVKGILNERYHGPKE